MPAMHEREKLVRAADRALRDAVEQCCSGLTEGERLRVVASVLGGAAAEVAEGMISEERNPEDPGRSHPDISLDMLTPRQVAKVLHLSSRTLEGMRYRGDGPPFAKLGGGRSCRILYRRVDLDAWVASRLRQSTTDDP